ncbi:sensor histidine kinase [Halocella sp. SP3-1]|uniref:sensor histidine kinase n=1 Tax=Halocella sp. SP3-1 TaxID=2382161 RepID=UPI000F76360A|nr:sensor histidine kinase [Halocella sp. SP3-1]AZO93629.1 sensor histidine kinase [Halocella sp. SP3-1]
MKQIKFFNSLRVKLGIITIFLIGVPIIIIAIIYSHNVKDVIIHKYTETAIESVYETAEKINFVFKDIQKFSTVIISNEELLKMVKDSSGLNENDYNSKLRSFITTRADIESIRLILGEKTYLIGANRNNFSREITHNLLESSGEPVWISTQNVEVEILAGKFEKYYFTLARKIIDFNTLKNYGFLLIDLDEVILEQAYSNIREENNGEIFICDKEGKIISHPDKNRIGSFISDKPYAAQVSENNSGYVEYKNKTDKLAIYSTIENSGWKIIKTISTDYLYKEINRIQNYIIYVGIFYGFLIILFMIIFSFRYTKPMFRMMGVIEKVEKGDLTVRMDVNCNDEIGQLGDSLNNMIDEMQNLINKLIKEEREKKEVELEALHAQINPHFLHNTLNTIKWMAKINGNESVSKAITALVKLLRISTNLGKDMITLGEEIEYVKNYLFIHRLRFNESIIVNFNMEEDCLDQMVPKFILQPVVENSIIYGMENDQVELNIIIKIFKNNDKIIIEIIDNGPGIDNETLKKILTTESDRNKFTKVGLNNIDRRLKLYFGKEYGVKIKSKLGQGTKVILILPIK